MPWGKLTAFLTRGCAFKIKLPKVKIKVKTGIKAVDNAMSAVSKSVKDVGKGIEKVGQGKIGEGLGDIGETYARTQLDLLTGGNKSKVDDLSGGLLTSYEGAMRGNTKDIARVGLTAGAAYLTGGVLAPMAVNMAMASGGDAVDGAIAGVSSGIASSTGSSGLGSVVKNVLNGITGKSEPSRGIASIDDSEMMTSAFYQESSTGNQDKNLLYMGGGLFALLLIILVSRK